MKYSGLAILIKLTVVVLIIISIASCNSNDKVTSIDKNGINQRVFLLENNNISDEIINELIEKSGIRKSGYVIIITPNDKNNTQTANNHKNKFYKQEIMAVHILKLDHNSILKKTEFLTIENASIICLLGNNKQLTINTYLGKSLMNAVSNGSLIVLNGTKNKQLEFVSILQNISVAD